MDSEGNQNQQNHNNEIRENGRAQDSSQNPERAQNRDRRPTVGGNRNNNPRRTQHDRKNQNSRSQQGNSGRGSGRQEHRDREHRRVPMQMSKRSVDMNKYEKMISAAKDNFADIARAEVTQECDICCKSADVFAVGSCRHPLCVECALRMRVLAKSNQCPVCRGEIEMLYVFEATNDLSSVPLLLPISGHPDEQRYGIRFENPKVGTTYEKYLSHVCKICKGDDGERKEFPTFMSLRQHMSSVHQLSYCHICTDNLNLFSRERKTYTRDELQNHIKHGDRDDHSMTGHPRCLFCDERFFDDEARYRHLRKQHYYCQFCEANGTFQNVFFGKHEELVKHYGQRHFLCESEQCTVAGIAFDTKMDLALHRATAHGETKNLLDFQFSDRDVRRQQGQRGNERGGDRPTSPSGAKNSARHQPSGGASQRISLVPAQPTNVPTSNPSDFVVVPSAQSSKSKGPKGRAVNLAPAYQPQSADFPNLGGSSSNTPVATAPTPQIVRPVDFPRLPKSKPAAAVTQQPSPRVAQIVAKPTTVAPSTPRVVPPTNATQSVRVVPSASASHSSSGQTAKPSNSSPSDDFGPPPGFAPIQPTPLHLPQQKPQQKPLSQTPKEDFPSLAKSMPISSAPIPAFVPPKKVTPAKLPAKQLPMAARLPVQRQVEDDFPSLAISSVPSMSTRNSASALAAIAPPTTEAFANKIRIAPKPVEKPIVPPTQQSVPKSSDFPSLPAAAAPASKMPPGWGAKKSKGQSVITGCIVPRAK